tara:strand:+ start:2776 stop:2997 length:222 start_codon:yes stop_codon:yes gene_type:complete
MDEVSVRLQYNGVPYYKLNELQKIERNMEDAKLRWKHYNINLYTKEERNVEFELFNNAILEYKMSILKINQMK